MDSDAHVKQDMPGKTVKEVQTQTPARMKAVTVAIIETMGSAKAKTRYT